VNARPGASAPRGQLSRGTGQLNGQCARHFNRRFGVRSRYVLLVQRRVKRKRGFTRLSPKRQITLPLAVVERAGLRVGEELAVEADEEGRVIVSRSMEEPVGERRRRALDRAAGALPGVWPAGALDPLREEWR